MHIYRIEDKDGYGYRHNLDSQISLFTSRGFYGNFGDNCDWFYILRPLPEDDGINIDDIREHHIFGFQTLTDLNQWFLPADLVMGNLLGAKLCVYSVHEIHTQSGKKQIMFDKNFATLVKKLPMDYFLDEQTKKSLFDFKINAMEIKKRNISIPDTLSFLLY
jgi:hypothetical protein